MRAVSVLALSLAAAVPAACAVIVPRADAIDCLMTSSPGENDTCTTFASGYSITVPQLVSLNPGLECPSTLDEDTEYCVLGSVSGSNGTTSVANNRTTLYTAPTSVNTLSSFDVTLVTATNTSSATRTIHTPYPVDSDIAKNCDKFYQIVKGDTCSKIASSHGISTDELYNWNKDVGLQCYGLYVGYNLCVHTPGAITSAIANATSSARSSAVPTSAVPTSAAPTSAVPTSAALTSAAPTSAAPTSTPAPAASAASPTSANASAAPSPTQPGTVDTCTKYHKVVFGDTCATIETAAGISSAEFAAWNPKIDSDCSNIYLNYYVCIDGPTVAATSAPSPTTGGSAVPSPTQPGTISTCSKFHKVVSGDYCGLIESEAGISADDFAKWNTGINSDCSNIYLGYYVCIGA